MQRKNQHKGRPEGAKRVREKGPGGAGGPCCRQSGPEGRLQPETGGGGPGGSEPNAGCPKSCLGKRTGCGGCSQLGDPTKEDGRACPRDGRPGRQGRPAGPEGGHGTVCLAGKGDSGLLGPAGPENVSPLGTAPELALSSSTSWKCCS